MKWLRKFVEESNRIEGIHVTSLEEVAAHAKLLELSELTVPDIQEFVSTVQPDAVLRNKVSVPGVRVGNHIAPRSGPEIEEQLKALLFDASDPYDTHVEYETLHPFTDGNGRSGRAVWLWMMRRQGGRSQRMAEGLGFLHSFYYQTLGASQSFWEYDLMKVPYDESVLFLTDAGHVYQDLIYDQDPRDYFAKAEAWGNGREIIAWAHVPARNS